MIMDESAAKYLVQYPLALIFIAAVAALAIFIGISMRKAKNKKEAAAAEVSAEVTETVSDKAENE